MIFFLMTGSKIGKAKKERKNKQKKLYIKKNCQLGFSSKIELPQLGLAWLGNFSARLGSVREISARTHH
jgi:hypothetical protein